MFIMPIPFSNLELRVSGPTDEDIVHLYQRNEIEPLAKITMEGDHEVAELITKVSAIGDLVLRQNSIQEKEEALRSMTSLERQTFEEACLFLYAAGHKIRAIKLYRSAFKTGLGEAKSEVERIYRIFNMKTESSA